MSQEWAAEGLSQPLP
jgi:hypothetical protein